MRFMAIRNASWERRSPLKHTTFSPRLGCSVFSLCGVCLQLALLFRDGCNTLTAVQHSVVFLAWSVLVSYFTTSLPNHLRLCATLAALMKTIWVMDLGYRLSMMDGCTWLPLLWRHRLLISNLTSLIRRSPVSSYWFEAAASWFTANLTDYLVSAPQSRWAAVVYACEVIIPGIIRTCIEQLARSRSLIPNSPPEQTDGDPVQLSSGAARLGSNEDSTPCIKSTSCSESSLDTKPAISPCSETARREDTCCPCEAAYDITFSSTSCKPASTSGPSPCATQQTVPSTQQISAPAMLLAFVQQRRARTSKSYNAFAYKSVVSNATIAVKVKVPPGSGDDLGK